jgi:hypothetical protein
MPPPETAQLLTLSPSAATAGRHVQPAGNNVRIVPQSWQSNSLDHRGVSTISPFLTAINDD